MRVFGPSLVALIALGSLCLSEAAVATAGPASPSSEGQFCSANPVRDYEKDIAGLAEEPLPSALPFAPSSLNASPLRVEGRHLIYQGFPPVIQLRNDSAAALALEWSVVMRATLIGTDQPSEVREIVGSLGPRGYQIVGGPPLGDPGAVRLEIEFFDSTGKRLGSYLEYLQVVPWTRDVRLGLSRSVVSPGDRLSFRLENLGTEMISYGLFFRIERFYKGKWVRVLDPGKVFAVAYGLGAGQGGRCGRARIPTDAQPGRYRVRKEFTTLVRPYRERYAVKTFWVRRG